MTDRRANRTQSLDRAFALLRLLASRDRFGWGITDLARRSGLGKSTVHRILSGLEENRLVDRDPVSHSYHLGALLVELGLSVSTHPALLAQGRERLKGLVERTGTVALFYLRSSVDAVVAGKCERTAHRDIMTETGRRRPLIMSAGGVAMLLAMSDEECSQTVEHNMQELRNMGIPNLGRFQRMLGQSVELGFAANVGAVVAGINSFGVCVRDAQRRPIGSLVLAGDTQRLPSDKSSTWIKLLEKEATALEIAVQTR